MSVTEMEHVLVLSDDIERTREFYCRVVGLQVGERPPLEITAKLESNGVGAVRNSVSSGPRQLFIEDPNGVRVEINVKGIPHRGGRDG